MKKRSIEFKSVDERKRFLDHVITPYIGEDLVGMLLYKGFCSAPASTKYHGAYEGGLFDHSLAVAYALQDLTDGLGLKWQGTDSPMRIGILHDICKVDLYKKKEDGTGWEYNSEPIIKGHGDKSAIYALRYHCFLNSEELACIIYHMGAYETDRWDAYDNAIKQYPNVLYTHTADMIASKIWGL